MLRRFASKRMVSVFKPKIFVSTTRRLFQTRLHSSAHQQAKQLSASEMRTTVAHLVDDADSLASIDAPSRPSTGGSPVVNPSDVALPSRSVATALRLAISTTPKKAATTTVVIPPLSAATSLRLAVSELDVRAQSSLARIPLTGGSDGGGYSHSQESKNKEEKAKEFEGWKLGLGVAVVGGILMFAPMPIYKKHTNHKELAKQLPHRVGKAVIFTWYPNPDTNSVGHQAMLVESLSGERFYVSLWPTEDHSYKVNILPLKFARLGAQFLDDIQHDIRKEEGNTPDGVAVIYNLDFDEMLNEYQRMRQAAEQGMLSFTLFQNTPSVLPYLARSSGTYSDAEVFISAERPQLADELDTSFHNCTSAVHHILMKGKYPSKLSLSPWGASPIGQHKEFEKIGAKPEMDPSKVAKYIESARNVKPSKAAVESQDQESHNKAGVVLRR